MRDVRRLLSKAQNMPQKLREAKGTRAERFREGAEGKSARGEGTEIREEVPSGENSSGRLNSRRWRRLGKLTRTNERRNKNND